MNDKIKRIDEFKDIDEFKTIQDLLDKYMDGATSMRKRLRSENISKSMAMIFLKNGKPTAPSSAI